jgi:hypothetical protein
MDPGKFQKKVLKLHKLIETQKLDKAAAGAAKLSGDDLSQQQRVALLSFQVKMIRLGKKEQVAQKILGDQRALVGRMAPMLAEAIRMSHDGQYDDSIPRLKGSLGREELEEEIPALSVMFPTARNIVHAHLLYSLDERACMKGTNRPTGFSGGEDRKHVLKFWSLPEAYYYMDIKRCPRCGSNVKGTRSGEPTGAQMWHLKCSNCGHDWKRLFAVVPPKMAPPG